MGELLVWLGGVVPLLAMLTALFAAVWVKEGERERTALAARSRPDDG